jgi:hypothetical protein
VITVPAAGFFVAGGLGLIICRMRGSTNNASEDFWRTGFLGLFLTTTGMYVQPAFVLLMRLFGLPT